MKTIWQRVLLFPRFQFRWSFWLFIITFLTNAILIFILEHDFLRFTSKSSELYNEILNLKQSTYLFTSLCAWFIFLLAFFITYRVLLPIIQIRDAIVNPRPPTRGPLGQRSDINLILDTIHEQWQKEEKLKNEIIKDIQNLHPTPAHKELIELITKIQKL